MQPYHWAIHEQIIRDIANRNHLSAIHAAGIEQQTRKGCRHYGEYAHHGLGFRPHVEAMPEAWDLLDLGIIMPLERVQLGLAPPLASAEKRRAFAELEHHACAALKCLEVLLSD